MLIDSYAEEDVFVRVPEVAAQTDPVLKTLDQLLEDNALLTQRRRRPGATLSPYLADRAALNSRRSVLPMLIVKHVKHLYGWSFRETEVRVADSLVLRWFCRVAFQPVPDKSTLIRWTHTLRPETLHALNDRVVELARQAKVTTA
jgi:transposase, IS5 family